MKTLALIAVTACTHPLQVPLGASSERQSQDPRQDDIAVCAPVPPLPERNKALLETLERVARRAA